MTVDTEMKVDKTKAPRAELCKRCEQKVKPTHNFIFRRYIMVDDSINRRNKMTEQEIKELRAHAGKLVAEGKSLNGVFEYFYGGNVWNVYNGGSNCLPNFTDGKWRIAKPKKKLINWSHLYFKGCATDYGELYAPLENDQWASTADGTAPKTALRLAVPANYHANWQPFFSTPENDAKLQELDVMVRVQVRWSGNESNYICDLRNYSNEFRNRIVSYRILGLQDGWTDNPEEAK